MGYISQRKASHDPRIVQFSPAFGHLQSRHIADGINEYNCPEGSVDVAVDGSVSSRLIHHTHAHVEHVAQLLEQGLGLERQ